MLITLKTIRQHTFKLEVDEAQTVLELKKMIEEQEGAEFSASKLKLIYSGKILQDAQPLGEYKLSESGFVVVMVSKGKPAAQPAPPPAPSQPSVDPTPSEPSGAAPLGTEATDSVVTRETPPATETTPPSEPEPPPPAAAPEQVGTSEEPPSGEGQEESTSDASLAAAQSNLVMGQQYIDAVVNIMTMGYDRDEVERAMAAGFNNPDRAVEYLMSGIPEHAFRPAGSGEEEAQPQGEGEGEGEGEREGEMELEGEGGEGEGEVEGGGNVLEQILQQRLPAPQNPPPAGQREGEGGAVDPLAFLRNMPQFAQFRAAIQRNPEMLQPMLQDLGQANPQLLAMISQNQEAFLRLINEPPADAPQGQGQGQGPPAPGQGGAHYIPVTPQDREAIERLKAMGFPEHMVIQAYFACEKNEEMAVNFLLNPDPED